MTDTDRIEFEQYRAIFAKLDALLAREGEVHIARLHTSDRRIVRVVDWNQETKTETIESVSGATLRDAMAQAAQVVQ